MRVIGIDPGTAIVGFGIIDFIDNKFKVIDYGCIYTSKDLPMTKRLLKISEDLEEILEKYKPDHMAVEELFYFKNNKTVISVGQARGVILLEGEKKGVRIGEYTPLQVKMGITGYGKSEKKQVQLMVQKILGLKEIPKPDDAADALAIAVTHINSLNSRTYNLGGSTIDIKTKSNKGRLTAEEYRQLLKLK